MLNSLIGQITSLKGVFSSGFMIGYALPVVAIYAVVQLVWGFLPGEPNYFGGLAGLSGVAALLTTIQLTVLAILAAAILQAFNLSLMGLYTGSSFPSWLKVPWQKWYRLKAVRLYRKYPHSDASLHYPDPRPLDGIDRTAPTDIGNALAAFEYHTRTAYGLSLNLFWPLLMDAIKDRPLAKTIEAAETGVIGWINASALLYLAAAVSLLRGLTLDWSGGLAAVTIRFGGAVLLYGLGLLAASIALTQTRAYTLACRSALPYRMSLFESLGVAKPSTLQQEQHLWSWLNNWMGYHDPYGPWLAVQLGRRRQLSGPWFGPADFHYSGGPGVALLGATLTQPPITSVRTTTPSTPGVWTWLLLIAGLIIVTAPSGTLGMYLKELAPTRVYLSGSVKAFEVFPGTAILHQQPGRAPAGQAKGRYLALKSIRKDVYYRDQSALPALLVPAEFAYTSSADYERLTLPLHGLQVKQGDLIYLRLPPPGEAGGRCQLKAGASGTMTVTCPTAATAEAAVKLPTLCTTPSQSLIGCVLAIAAPVNDKVTVLASRASLAALLLTQVEPGSFNVMLTSHP